MIIKDTDFPSGNITAAELDDDFSARTNYPPTTPKKPAKELNKGFPDVLPPSLRLYLEEAQKAFGLSSDYLATSILYAASVAIGKTHQLEVKHGSKQAGNLFLVLIGNPNSNKSAALKRALAPIYQRQTETYQDYKTAKSEYEVICGMSKKERESESITELPLEPVWMQSLTGDTTPEALAEILQKVPRGIGVHRDEIAGWFKSFNRYNGGGEQEMWLSIWSLEPLVINRKNGEPKNIPMPYAPVAGTIQPSVLEEITKGNRASNGFMDRILFVWPQDLEKPRWENVEMPQSLLDNYKVGINKLLELDFEEDKHPVKVLPTEKAKKLLFQYFNETNKPLCDKAENELIAGLHGKFDVHAQRLALLLQMLWYAFEGSPKDVLELETAKRAIELAEYFRGQSLLVYERVSNASPVDKLPSNHRAIYDALPEEFKKADGLAIAERMEMKPKTFSRMITNKQLFEKVRHGEYSKIY